MAEQEIISTGIFIDGGYFAKINESLNETSGMALDISKLLHFVRASIAEREQAPKCCCQATECHYFRGRYRAGAANAKKLLFAERKFEDELIENDVIFHYKHLREINGEIIEKGIDVWYALEAYELATIRQFDYVVLVTGDADHEMLIKKLKALKIKVVLLTGDFGEHSATSKLLSDEASYHVDLGELIAEHPELLNNLCNKV